MKKYCGNYLSRWVQSVSLLVIGSIYLPRDPISDQHYGYCFVEFKKEIDSEYAIKVLSPIKLFSKVISLRKINSDELLFIGATIFIGNLHKDVDEKMIFDSFSIFGKIIRKPQLTKTYTSNGTKYYALVSYDSYESADSAVHAMHGQIFGGNIIQVKYSYKKNEVKTRGSITERMLDENRKFFRK
mmetsp:Transcript_21995/g.30695  ORF Transcript_21995/g.30695 Transcript_21995/m.30695 type:complete len:185 (+) Transcript_21995:77-631(+)